jgi:hypothetical protein
VVCGVFMSRCEVCGVAEWSGCAKGGDFVDVLLGVFPSVLDGVALRRGSGRQLLRCVGVGVGCVCGGCVWCGCCGLCVV